MTIMTVEFAGNGGMRPKIYFLLVGASSAVIYYGAVALLYEVMTVDYRTAVSVGYVLSVLSHFFANRHFTFKGGGDRLGPQVFRYFGLTCINYVLTLCVVTAAVELFRLSPYIAVAISIVATMAVSYLLMRHWVFAKAR